MDILTHALEMMKNIQIGVSQNRNSQAAQIRIPDGVFPESGVLVMLGPVQFYHELRLRAVKIDDIAPQDLLPADGCGQRFQKVIPKMAFLLGHAPP